MSDIEALLQMQAAEDYESSQTAQNVAAALGALAGGGIGFDTGSIQYGLQKAPGDLGRKIQDLVNPQMVDGKQVMRTAPGGLRRAITPGPRFAGTLVGAILGGALGKEVANQAMGESEAANLLAKAQVQGELSNRDLDRIQQLIVDQQRATGII